MSLINEALKKAQRQRAETETPVTPPMPGDNGGRVVKRGKPHSAQTTLLLAGGGLALVILSVVATVLLLNRPDSPTEPAAVAAKNPSPSSAAASAPATSASGAPATPPIVVAPVIKPVESTPPASTPAAAPASSSPVAAAKAPSPAPTAPTSAAPKSTLPAKPAEPVEAPKTAATAAPATPVPNPNARADERVHAFVDAIRVTGIRASGGDSRVLMNERVYRVNDIVERTLEVRLIRVDSDSLSFIDANGYVYVKYF